MPARDDRPQPTSPDVASPDVASPDVARTETKGLRTLPRPRTPEGRAGLAALLRESARALIALDFDGTLSPIVADPDAAHAHPAAGAALSRLAAVVGTLAVITGRPAAVAVELGGLAGVPGLIVLGHYGWERWQDGALTSPAPPPGVAAARTELPAVLADAGAPPGTWTEDKVIAVAVHTRRAADPQGALEMLRGPLTALAERTGLAVEPGRLVIELRPPGTDKGTALSALITERSPGSVMFGGDDLGDLAAFGAVRALRASGLPGLTVCSGSAETAAELLGSADLVVDGPDGIIALLDGLAEAVGG
jgi:trehalose 6-phosphate phosphatase